MSEAPNPTAELDAAVRAQSHRLREPTRGLLLAAIAPDARDPWVRDTLLAYCRLWIRHFDRDEPHEVTVGEMSCDDAPPDRPRRTGRPGHGLIRT